MTEIRDILSVVLAILTAGSMLYTWLTARGRVNSDDIRALSRRVDDTEDRVMRIETDLRYVPSRDAVHELQLSMTQLRGDMEVLSERLKPIASISDRLQDFMLEQNK